VGECPLSVAHRPPPLGQPHVVSKGPTRRRSWLKVGSPPSPKKWSATPLFSPTLSYGFPFSRVNSDSALQLDFSPGKDLFPPLFPQADPQPRSFPFLLLELTGTDKPRFPFPFWREGLNLPGSSRTASSAPVFGRRLPPAGRWALFSRRSSPPL